MKLPTLLVVGDGVVPTGFARVVHSILENLEPRFDIHHLAINYSGDPHSFPWKIYPASIGGDPMGAQRLPWLVEEQKPDLIFIVGNLPRIEAYMKALGERAASIPVVVYSPVEGEPIPLEQVAAARGVDSLVFYTEFAKREFEKALAQSGDKTFTDVRVIPHGIDTSIFYPFEPDERDRDAVKQRARSKLFNGDRENSQSFVVFNGNRNQPRKCIDLTIRGFAEFARDKDRFVKLHLHMGIKDVGWDVVSLCKRFGIYDRLILTTRHGGLPGISVEQLNGVYNAADVGINTASSEGWGLVSFEHAATRSAQVVPRHASCEEIWSGTAELVEPCMSMVDPESMSDQQYVAPGDVAAALERLYDDAEHRQEIADKCYALATDPGFRWDRIASRWEALFNELLGR